MSNEAQAYAARVKVGDITAKFVLSRLADRADERFSCFPSVPLLAAEAEKSPRVVQRALAHLRTLRLVSDRETKRADGSQGANRYYLHGPWDNYAGTGVPFPEIVTPKEKRSQMWAERPTEGTFRGGTAAAVAVSGDQNAAAALEAAARAAALEAEAAAEVRREKARTARKALNPQAQDISAGQTGVTCTSPPPTTCTSSPPVTPTSPLEPSGETPNANLPAVPPSFSDPEMFANAGSDGRMDGGEVEQQDQEQSGEPPATAEAPTSPAAPVASEGVVLLMTAAAIDPRAALAGRLLLDLGLHVEGLLAAGWDCAYLLAQITAPRPPENEVRTTDAAMTAARIRAIPMSPPAGYRVAPGTVPAQVSRPAAPKPFRPPCPGTDGRACGQPISVPGAVLCTACANPCPNGCGRAANSARPDRLCRTCAERADDERLSRCIGCGEQPATRLSGLCSPCHRARHGVHQGQSTASDDGPSEQAAAPEADLERVRAQYAHRTGATRPGGCIEGVNGCQAEAVREDGRCEDCHLLWTSYQARLDELAPAYAGQAGQESPPPPF